MNTVIIPAAGKGSRMGADINKQYISLKGKPLLLHTLEVFLHCNEIDEIVLVINPGEKEICEDKVLKNIISDKPIKVIDGGANRQQSVYNGLKNININSNIVIIHDGARPFITKNTLKKCIIGAKKYNAVSFGVPIKETLKVIDNNEFVIKTTDRSNIWITQTPQAFKSDLIIKAHEKAIKDKIVGTDDAMLVESLQFNVKMILGDYNNIKITTIEDLAIAESIFMNFKRD